jgi:hypothetical protein
VQALQAPAGGSWADIWANATQDSSRRCGGDSSVMTGTGRSRRADNTKQEQFARVEADKGLHRFFTALHRKHEKIWGSG